MANLIEKLLGLKTPEERADRILFEHLTREQRREYEQHDYFTVKTARDEYTLWRGTTIRKSDGARLCAVIPGNPLVSDQLLARKLYLEADEEAFLATAIPTIDPNIPLARIEAFPDYVVWRRWAFDYFTARGYDPDRLTLRVHECRPMLQFILVAQYGSVAHQQAITCDRLIGRQLDILEVMRLATERACDYMTREILRRWR